MSSPESPASSVGSDGGSYHLNMKPNLEELVGHFLASKRALNTTTVLWRANEIVTTARELLEENAVLSAKNSFLRCSIDEQLDFLEAVRRGIDVVESEVRAEYKSLLHNLDTSFSGLQSTLAVLRETPIEASLQPVGGDQKHLFDFIDSNTVEDLSTSLRACIDRYNDAVSALHDSTDSFDASIENLHNTIANVPNTPATASNPTPIPELYHDLEAHAKEAAQCFQSLVRHYDLCVTALKHTEGGSAAATQATEEHPESSADPSASTFAAPPEPISDVERDELLAVLVKDAQEVEDVVSEIQERGSEMEFLLSNIISHISLLRNEHTSLISIVSLLSTISTSCPTHIMATRSFLHHWSTDSQPTITSGIEEWEGLREFYERFDLAYAELIVEISARRRRHEKAKKKAEEAQRELDRLFEEDGKAREAFAVSQGDFLPLDIWPGLRDPPRRYEVMAVGTEVGGGDVEGEEEAGEGAGSVMGSIPKLERNVVERALARVKRRM